MVSLYLLTQSQWFEHAGGSDVCLQKLSSRRFRGMRKKRSGGDKCGIDDETSGVTAEPAGLTDVDIATEHTCT